ncbi:RHS repeat-associated core domain-containing protein [Salmonella enterica]|nr:RHS repeat-associated core domain-containing protein [Salmonella enterica]
MTEVILPGGETLTFTRDEDEAGREIRRAGSRGFVQEQGWNEANQLISQRAGHYHPEAPVSGAAATAFLYTSLSREYGYDGAGNLAQMRESGEPGSDTLREYRTDRNGQVTGVTVTGGSRGTGSEYYRYDSCGYLTGQSAGRHRINDDTDLYQRGHRLKRAGNTEYGYDAAGRMISRTKHRDGWRPEKEQFRWDCRDQLTGYSRDSGGKVEQWEYRYDGSGRRTEKRCDQKGIRITYLWDGDNIAEIREYRDDKLYSVRHLVFDGFELLSQQYGKERQAHPTEPVRWTMRTGHAVSEQTGRPVMFFNSVGEVVRRARDVTLWGQPATAATADYEPPRQREDEETDPGLLYAGQWRDAESGLCYNRFRYYEPESGMYLVSDPIGLAGGLNLYAYVPNPLGYIDPLGLACVCPDKANRLLDSGASKVTVRSRSDAEQLFLDRYVGDGYRNMTGESGPSTKNLMEFLTNNKTKAGTYHWDDVMDPSNPGRVAGHGPENPDGDLPHLQIHQYDGKVIHIFFPWE